MLFLVLRNHLLVEYFCTVELSHEDDDSRVSVQPLFMLILLSLYIHGPIYLVSVVNGREDEVAYNPRRLHAKTMTSCFVPHK